MAIVFKDRVKQTSTTGGTGALEFTAAVTGYQTFSSTVTAGTDEFYYLAANTSSPSEWEVGIGTASGSPLSLQRSSANVLASSNSGALVNFTASDTVAISITLPSAGASGATYRGMYEGSAIAGQVIGITLDSAYHSAPTVEVTKLGSAVTAGSNTQLNVNTDGGDYTYDTGDVTVSAGTMTIVPGWRLENAFYENKSVSVTTQDALPTDIAFKSDGTAMYVVGTTNDSVYQYTLSTAWDVSTATYATKSVSVTTQETNPQGVTFSSDGTAMYVVGTTNDTVYQYTLSTAWDVSTATYASKSVSVNAQDAVPLGLAVNSDGTAMYVVGNTNDTVYQYTLSIAWDVSTATYSSKSVYIGTQEGSPSGVVFKSDGTKMYVIGQNSDSVHQYTLSTAWDVSTASYANVSYVIGLQDGTPTGVTFSANGTKMYVVGFDNDSVYQYDTSLAFTYVAATTNDGAQIQSQNWTDINSMSVTETLNGQSVFYAISTDARTTYSIVPTWDDTERDIARNNAGTWEYNDSLTTTASWNTATINAEQDAVAEAVGTGVIPNSWEVATAVYANKSVSVTAQDISPNSAKFSTDGTVMIFVGAFSGAAYQYTLSTAWDVSTATYASKSFSFTTQEAEPTSLCLSSDGTKMYTVGTTNDTVYQYTLSTAWDVSTASYASKSFSVATQTTAVTDMVFSADGTVMYVVDNTADTVFQYTLSTAWDVSTATYASKSFSVTSQDTTPAGIAFNPAGTSMYIAGSANDTIYQYTLSTAWDVSTATYASKAVSVTSQDTAPAGIAFSPNGDIMFISGAGNDYIYQYTLGGWDLYGTTYASKSVSVATQDTSPTGVSFSSDGTAMYVMGNSNDTVFQYTLSTAWDVSTATYATKSFSVTTQDTVPQGVAFSSDGTKMYVVGSTSDTVYQYTLSTAWDVSTASYASKSVSVTSQDTSPTGVAFSSDGTKMYVVGDANNIIYQYTLSTAWDVSTATYASKYVSVLSQDALPTGIAFSPDGVSMYVAGNTNDAIYLYTLSTAWDVSTATYATKSVSVATQDTWPQDVTFSLDGTKMYIIGTTNDTVYQYTLPTTKYPNQMTGTELAAVSDANQFALGSTIDAAIVFYTTDSASLPTSDGISVNYDASAIYGPATYSTDYTWDTPDSTTVRVTAVQAGTYKVKVT